MCGDNNFPTLEQCIIAENLCVARELEGTHKYVYKGWKNEKYGTKNAYYAGYTVCLDYENPSDAKKKAEIRGNRAEQIYSIMMGK